jgi:toxin ParE1/3/4
MKVLRSPQYWESLQAIQDHIAIDNPLAATDMWLHIDDQVDSLSDPNFPRRLGRVQGTYELVAHPSYVVILMQSAQTVTVIDVLHTARQYP